MYAMSNESTFEFPPMRRLESSIDVFVETTRMRDGMFEIVRTGRVW